MIENWKQAWRMYTVHIYLLAGALAGLEQCLPALEGVIPPGTYAGLMILGIVARLIRQRSLGTPESTVEELKRIKAIAKKGGLISIVLLAIGCASRQPISMQELVERANMPPERAACLIATEAAYRARDAACKKDRTGDCSTDALIDKQHEEIDLCFSNF